MPNYLTHVTTNPFLLMSPCADKFGCPKQECNKNVCAISCCDLALYRKMLDTYGKYSMGGLSPGHTYQSAVPAEDELQLSFPQARGNKSLC